RLSRVPARRAVVPDGPAAGRGGRERRADPELHGRPGELRVVRRRQSVDGNERTGEPGGRVLGFGVRPSRRLSKRGAQQHQQPVRRVPGAAGGTGRVEHRRFLAVWQALIVLIFGLGIAHAGTECSEGTSMTTNETLTLEPKAIVAFLDRFLDRGFDLERA